MNFVGYSCDNFGYEPSNQTTNIWDIRSLLECNKQLHELWDRSAVGQTV